MKKINANKTAADNVTAPPTKASAPKVSKGLKETPAAAPDNKKVKKATAEAPANNETAGKKGRTSAMAGCTIKKLKKDEETGLRPTGKVRECWNVITNGITVEAYRAAAPDSGLARRVLADFIVKGLVELVEPKKK